MTEQQAGSVSLGVDLAQLQARIGAVEARPAAGQTVVRVTTAWLSGFQSQAHVRHFTIPMDEPRGLGGSDTAPNMVEMVLGAYGCCLTTGYVMHAALRGIAVERIEIDVEGDLDLTGFFGLSPDTWPGCATVRATVHLTAPHVSVDQLQALHAVVTQTSPVGSMLARPVQVSTTLDLRSSAREHVHN